MRLKFTCLAAALALATPVAIAEITATVTGVTDYDFRGLSQTAGDPALQGSVDYAGDLFYASAWASTIDFGDDVDGNIELDLVAGFAGELGGGLRWDVGTTWYLYPGSTEDLGQGEFESADYWEFYVGGGLGPVDVRYWYSPDLYDVGETASYFEANAGFGLPWELGLNLHAGYSFGDAFDLLEDTAAELDPGYPGDDADYYDYSVGLARSFGHLDLEVKYVGNITDGDYWDVDTGTFRNDERVIFSVSTTFPWSDDAED